MSKSRRDYITIAQVTTFAGITPTLEEISQAEELIDQYVGFQCKSMEGTAHGQITAVSNSNKTFADTNSNTQLYVTDNFFSFGRIEIIGGTGIGQSALIVSSSRTDKTVTIDTAFSTTPDTTSVFKIYQLGKFPRDKDTYVSAAQVYYKSIPELVRDATAAQVAYMDAMGDSFFAQDGSDKDSESMGNYSYSKGSGSQSAMVRMVAPRARTLLRGVTNRTGQMLRD